MKVTIDGKEISTAAVLWLIKCGRTVLDLSDEDFQLFSTCRKIQHDRGRKKITI